MKMIVIFIFEVSLICAYQAKVVLHGLQPHRLCTADSQPDEE
jgi:hypothetical protein